MSDRNRPAVEAARRALANDETNGCMIEQHEGNGMWTCFAHGVSADGPDMCWYVRDMPPIVLTAAREHYTADDLRDTPAGQALIREGIAAARNLEWMQPRVTPGGRIFNPAIPGDEMRAVREEALAREAMQNMRESEQGRALMAEAWRKFQEHYAAEWEEAYPEDVFPSPAPAPAVVSRESVAASMMRQWAKNLRSDRNPFEEDDA